MGDQRAKSVAVLRLWISPEHMLMRAAASLYAATWSEVALLASVKAFAASSHSRSVAIAATASPIFLTSASPHDAVAAPKFAIVVTPRPTSPGLACKQPRFSV